MIFSYEDLLSGEAVFFDGVGHIRSPKLKELTPERGIGLSTYYFYLNILSWDKNRFLELTKRLNLKGSEIVEKYERFTYFDVLTVLGSKLLEEVLTFFLCEKAVWDEEERKYIVFEAAPNPTSNTGKRIGEITFENFDELRAAILQMNYIKLGQPKDLTFASEHAREVWERTQGYLSKHAARETETLSIGNVTSKLCAIHHSYNLLNVYELTVFQLYDQFFQCGYLRTIDLNERIYSNYGGEKFNMRDWMKPVKNL